MTVLLEVENLTVDIPLAAGDLHAVRGVDFTVKKGETLGIVGESGCGKSITSFAIMNLLPQSAVRNSRRLVFDGQALDELSEEQLSDIRGNKMSMIFQEPMTSLNPSYTIGEQLIETLLRHRKIARKEAVERAVFLLEKVGITAAASRLKQYPHQLSGGLRQRVMIAMALMCGPEMIIADEPTTALDVTIQAQILNLLAEIQSEFQMGQILITHDLGVIASVAHRVAVMYAGQFVETGSVAEVFEMPMHPYTQGLLACIPIPGKTKRGSFLGSIPGKVPTLIGDQTGCSFANRCTYVKEACLLKDVPINSIGSGRSYRCILSSEICYQNAREAVCS